MISLVMTTYNHAAYIREALDSVVAQNIPGLQVIIVDDGSKDETLKIAREFEERGFEIYSKLNGGPSDAVNYGLSYAKGEFIVLLSGDDKLLPDSIAQRVDALRNGRADIVSCLPEWINGDSNSIPNGSHPEMFKHYSFDDPLKMFDYLYANGNMICAPSVAMTRSCLDKVGAFNQDLWQLQDYEYWLRACAKGQTFRCMSEACVSYRWHSRNLSASNFIASEREFDFVMQSAPELLNRSQLISLLWGSNMEKLADAIDTEIFRALLRLKHTRPSVKNVGRWQLRNISKENHHREVILRHLF
ncbi:glycosyltransferase [Brucella rhizosphaerae]|uniref:glycosyltransferase n=1 Tax=Brucella rhizosphaerae TaxID=571254 RepID=UPI000465D70E|nr:glycosyltransferase [Brucella rhizosphaerae]